MLAPGLTVQVCRSQRWSSGRPLLPSGTNGSVFQWGLLYKTHPREGNTLVGSGRPRQGMDEHRSSSAQSSSVMVGSEQGPEILHPRQIPPIPQTYPKLAHGNVSMSCLRREQFAVLTAPTHSPRCVLPTLNPFLSSLIRLHNSSLLVAARYCSHSSRQCHCWVTGGRGGQSGGGRVAPRLLSVGRERGAEESGTVSISRGQG